jgi:alkanesulfonate monooxygenase SsuD/methylene tetrahydromethanopterin reductase-like flavin-dependent oxidoreductase (luciferase family)
MTTVVQEPIKFSLFDWLDESGRGFGETYNERLRVLEQADEAGFYAYHLAEHHGTELSTVPSPNLFLSAVAQRTSRLRMGPLGYVLPAYNPLRLMEEVCMLDQLSGGRVELGLSRGSSPHEGEFFGVKREDSRAVFDEALQIMLQGFTTGLVDFHGRFFDFDNVPSRQHPVQKPYPPLWYPTSNMESIPWLGGQGMNAVFAVHLAPDFERIVEMLRLYRESYAAHKDEPNRLNGHVERPLQGFSMHVHVADTDARAYDQAKVGYARFIHNFTYRYTQRGDTARHADREDFDAELRRGRLLVGSPDTVRRQLQRNLEVSGANYFVGCFTFGDLPLEQIQTSLGLFTREVMPALETVTLGV